jgi:hypothetical protein
MSEEDVETVRAMYERRERDDLEAAGLPPA